MNFNKIKSEELETIYPNNTGIVFKSMSKDSQDNYMELYYLYRKLFTQYIIEKLNLKMYDEKIENSGLDFKINNEEDMDVYQYFSSNALKYFYIRNNIYIEKLDDSSVKILKRKIKANNYELDEEARELIENTYRTVIFEDSLKDGSLCMTLFGPNSINYFARNDALVIGVRYDEFGQSDLDDNSWDKLHDEQLFYLYGLVEEMNNKFIDDSSIPVSIIKYNEFSTRSRINKNENMEMESR